MNSLQSHYESAFNRAVDGNIYHELAPMDRLAHNRRVELLQMLPLPDLARLTIVDYGVGAWGIGAVFEKLKTARRAIGIDISATAVALSRKLSEADVAMRNCEFEYHVADGYSLPLASDSVDVFFSGECIEHIEDTDSHLCEVCRVLRPGGLAIFTTPNALPWVYRRVGLRWCVGFEHVALMSTAELVECLEARFAVEKVVGFNQSMYPTLDALLPETAAMQWVGACESEPDDATSVIALVRKVESPPAEALRLTFVEYSEARPSGAFSDLDLSPGFKGRMIDTGGALHIRVPSGSLRCNMILWSHTWSGRAEVRANSASQDVDLYSHVGGCRRIVLSDLDGASEIIVRSLDERDARSEGGQVIFFRAVFAGVAAC